jgi:hypothetical protein
MLYSKSLAYVVNKDSDNEDNPNLCYVARLDNAILMFMVRVYQDV